MDVSWRRQVGAAVAALIAILGFAVIVGFDVRLHDAGRPDLAQISVGALPFLLGIAALVVVGATLTVRTQNLVGLLFLALGLAMVASGVVDGYSRLALVVEPGRWPAGDWLAYLDEASFIPWLLLITVLLLITPTGSLTAPHWRAFVVLVAVAGLVLLISRSLLPGRFVEPFAAIEHPWTWDIAGLGAVRGSAGAILSAAPLVAASTLIVRFRASRGTERQQLRWVAFGAAVAAAALGVTAVAAAFDLDVAVLVGSGIALAALPLATGVAVSRYRLFDLDRLISRTISWALVTVSLVALWSSGVLVVSRLVSGSTGSALPASIATLVTALAAGPILRRVRDEVDRRFRRRRYEALRAVAQYVARPSGPTPTVSIENVLCAAVEDPDLSIGYWLEDREAYVDGSGRPCEPDAGALIIERDGARIAAVSTTAARALLQDACAVALPELAAARLRSALQLRIEEVTASRARLTSVAAEERKNLERDLHDGAQQRLLAVLCALEATKRAESGAAMSLDEAIELTRGALAELRGLSHGLRPVNLQDGGVEVALRAVVGASPLPASMKLRGIPPEPNESIASMAYYVVSEALTNAAKHAGATSARVSVSVTSGQLRVAVKDDGVGGADPTGPGLRGLADRAESLGGLLTVTSPAGHGTEICVEVPCES